MTPLYGLVVCGGKSSRMGTDKSLLEYYGKPHRYYLYQLLQQFCQNVFISCSKAQHSMIPSKYETILDNRKYEDIGPMASLLSAYEQFPEAAFLVLGCDYPFISEQDIQLLVNARFMTRYAVSYNNEETDYPEPLLSIYEPEISPLLLNCFSRGEYSLRLLLQELGAYKLFPYSPASTVSVDTPNEYYAAIEWLKEIGAPATFQ